MKLSDVRKEPFTPEKVIGELGTEPQRLELWISPHDRALAAFHAYERNTIKWMIASLAILFVAVFA